VSRDGNAGGMRFIDNEANVVCRINVLLRVDNNFDYLRSKIDVLAYCSPELVAGVRERVFGILQQLSIRGSVPELTAKGSDDPASVNNVWAGNDTETDCFGKICIKIISCIAHVADRGETCLQHFASVLRAKNRAESLPPLDRHDPKISKIPLIVDCCAKVGMRIHQSWKHRVITKVDGYGAGWNLNACADGGDFPSLD